MANDGGTSTGVYRNAKGAYTNAWMFYHNGADAGTLFVNNYGSAVDWTATSDRRWKKNIKPLEDWTEKVVAIGKLAHRFDWKDAKQVTDEPSSAKSGPAIAIDECGTAYKG